MYISGLETKGLVLDEDNLDAVGVEGVGALDDLVVDDGRGGDTIGIAGASALGSEGKLMGALVGLVLILDDLVGTSENDHVASTKGDTADLGARKISMDELAVLGDSRHGGQVVIDGGTDGAAELTLLGIVLLGEDGGMDVVPGAEVATYKEWRERKFDQYM